MVLPRFSIREPRSLGEALEIMAEGGPEAAALAGGTDLVVAMKKGLKAPRLVVSLARIPDLERIEKKKDRIVIGPLVTMAALCRSSLVREAIPILADGAASVAAPLVRNRATVGGNLCNARPCADTAPPLMALGAFVVLESAGGGARTLPLDAMIKGPGETVREPGELLTAIEVPLPTAHSGGAYMKMIRRRTLDITIAGVAVQVALDGPGGVVTKARIFAASVAPAPLRLPETEACVVGRPVGGETLAAAAASASGEVRPIDDLRGEAWYRRHVSGVLVKRALGEAARRAGEAGS